MASAEGVVRCIVFALTICSLSVNGQNAFQLNALDIIKRVQGAEDKMAPPPTPGPFATCPPAARCMPASECPHNGPVCAPSSVCCFPFNNPALGSNGTSAGPAGPGTNASDDVSMRSVSGAQGYQGSFGPQGTPGQRSGDPIYGQVQGNSYGSAYDSGGYNGLNSPNYGGGYVQDGAGSYGQGGQGQYNPTGYPTGGYPSSGDYQKPGYGNYPARPDYGSFDHAYGGQLGQFAPDFYGAQFDLRWLSVPARDVLHKFRYREICGIKKPDLFPALPYGPLPPNPYGRPSPPRPVYPVGKLGEHPWQAAVLGWSPRGYGLRCSATLVHPQLLVTSGHCLEGIVEPELKVLLGVSDLLTPVPFLPTIERAVARIFVHEKFNSASLAHDVALLLLAKPVNLNLTPHVAPVCLPRQNQTFVASNCYIVSWSRAGPSRGGPPPYSNAIRVSDMTFIGSKADCEKKVAAVASRLNPSQLTEEMHCIKGASPTSCMGSAGGSLFCDVDPATTSCSANDCYGTKTSYLAGILTFSNEKCGEDGLAVITELSPYVPWIDGLLSGAGGFKNFNPAYFGNLAGSVYGQGEPVRGYPGYPKSRYGGYPKPAYGGQGYGAYPKPAYGGQGYGGYPKPAFGGQGYGGYPKAAYGGQGYGGYPKAAYDVQGYGGYSTPAYDGQGYGGYPNPAYGEPAYDGYPSTDNGNRKYGADTKTL